MPKKKRNPWGPLAPATAAAVRATPVAKVRARWRRWLNRILNDVTALYHRLEIHHDLTKVIEANPAVTHPPVLVVWLRTNYGVAQAMAIRRLLDHRQDVISLLRLLREVEAYPELVSRVNFRSKTRGKLPREAVDESFVRLARTTGTNISARQVRKDIRRLQTLSDRIRKTVDKRLAHAAPLNDLRKVTTYKDLERVIEEIDQIAVRYEGLLIGGFLTTARAAKLNYLRVLESAWIPPEQRGTLQLYPGPRHTRL